MSAMDDLIAEIERLKKRIADLETQDLPFGALTDYGGTSTIVGWSSRTATSILYKKVGKLVHVWIIIIGTSNSTSTSVTLPYQNNAGPIMEAVGRGMDNGTNLTAPTRFRLPNASATLEINKDLSGAAWTASGAKEVRGQFVYETSS
jgi:hypothetical protein